MALVAALLAAAAAYTAWPAGGEARLERVLPSAAPAPAALPERTRRHGAALAGAVGVALLAGGARGLLLAPVAWYALAAVLARAPAKAEVERAREAARHVPIACDLLAACLVAGSGAQAGLAAVAAAVGGPLGDELAAVARRWLLGGSADAAWAGSPLAGPGGPLHAVAAACRRAERSGMPPADLLTEVADELRDAARAEGEAAARRAGVLAVAPLGLCFLPAFVLLGVVPLVAGLFARLG